MTVHMQPHWRVFIVGGYVRDRLLGREATDHDFVVCGATPDEMVAAGFVPVEASAFPVYHHPLTRDEFALARTEKKTGPGYHGFEVFSDPNVTVEDDLRRRDLTINAMAREVVGWTDEGHAKLNDLVVDPFNGRQDLANGVVRHVSDAFLEDPVRALRAARFAARYGFVVAPETVDLVRKMAVNGELDNLTAERVGLEVKKAADDGNVVVFFDLLDTMGVTAAVFPDMMNVGHHASAYNFTHALNFSGVMALLTLHLSDDAVDRVAETMRWENDTVRDVRVARVVHRTALTSVPLVSGGEWVRVMDSLDLFRRPEARHVATDVLFAADMHLNAERMMLVFDAVKEVSFDDLSPEEQKTLKGREIGESILNKRVELARSLVS